MEHVASVYDYCYTTNSLSGSPAAAAAVAVDAAALEDVREASGGTIHNIEVIVEFPDAPRPAGVGDRSTGE
jgi:hypothetical protein